MQALLAGWRHFPLCFPLFFTLNLSSSFFCLNEQWIKALRNFEKVIFYLREYVRIKIRCFTGFSLSTSSFRILIRINDTVLTILFSNLKTILRQFLTCFSSEEKSHIQIYVSSGDLRPFGLPTRTPKITFFLWWMTICLAMNGLTLFDEKGYCH